MDSDTAADRTLDVREIDGEPFGEIVSALEALSGEERLVLLSEFEPLPLYGVLEERGFVHEATQAGPDEWRIRIERE